MHPAVETLIYSAIFVSLYFEVFILLTYVSKDAYVRRTRPAARTDLPKVAVVVPCYNEEHTVKGTVNSLLNIDYPDELLSILLVDDGSTDNTGAVLDEYADIPNVTVVHSKNSGKHAALNMGIERSVDAEFIACLDADSFVHPGALRELVSHFTDEKVGAVAASLAVHDPKNAIEHMQYAEYLLGIAFRHILSSVGGLYVIPGPFSVYRKSTLIALGGFKSAHNTEDMEIALRMQREGYRIENAPRALVFTKAPKTVFSLVKQRTRWTTGFIRNGFDYRALFGNPRYGVLGLLVLPLAALSIIMGLGLFVIAIVQTTDSIVTKVITQGDVPLSYALQLKAFDWFYIPVSGLAILGIVTIAAITTFMLIGRKISKVPGTLGVDIIWYLALYGLVAPLWLIRAVYDVAFGIRRGWR